MISAGGPPPIYRMFQRFFDDGLAQASFLVGCDRTKQAVVIDPRRDAAIYLDAAQQLGATIVAAIETHVHADFVSGARELAQQGARIMTGPGAGLHIEHLEVRRQRAAAAGRRLVDVSPHPGHTPEHICVLATPPRRSAEIFTGDLLFVGGVGRPDLLGDEHPRSSPINSSTRCGAYCRSTTARRCIPATAPDRCAAPASARNPRPPSAGSGVRTRCCSDDDRSRSWPRCSPIFPDTPPYFARMKRVNAEGPPLLGRDLGGAAPAVDSAGGRGRARRRRRD